ncbi:MAG TPA: helix-turn-helix domain-containing protein [Thermoplasmata archaeon]|nr:helix-turn-helix domain-containing protein [Thermoplasmata archaeon]
MPGRQLRDRTIERIRGRLESAGFYVSDAHHIRPTSFDLMARRDSLLLILKVLKNIDALDPTEAARLKELSELFGASVVLIGESSGAARLESGVVYNRYGIPILDEASLQEYLEKGVPPFLFSSPGGIFARIDGERLRELRELHRLSLGALASIAGVSRRTIQLYEEGTGAEISVVERLEEFMGEPIARPIEVFRAGAGVGRAVPGPEDEDEEDEDDDSVPRPGPHRPKGPIPTGDPLRDTVFQQLDGMGWQVSVTVRCPFDAFSQGRSRGEEQILLTAVGSIRSAQHRADLLQGIARVAEGHALYIVKGDPNRRSIDGLALFTMRDLRRHRDPAELVEEITVREGA